MKKGVFIAMLVGLTSTVPAQDKALKSPDERARIRTERMSKELELSPEQIAKVESINLKYAGKGAELRKKHEAERTQARQEGKAMREAEAAELKAVLTPDQYAKWEAKQEEMKARRMERRRGAQGRRSE
jgi:polynucleotide 5'-kinase involved in rRNA processing